MAFFPPKAMEVAFTLDTTGSMSQALDEVKGRVSDMIQRLLADIPTIKMAAIAHGDYCDEHVFYLTQTQDLTSNLPDLVNFVGGLEGTGGGDTAECYELVLKMVRENLGWTPGPGSDKILVMIGDAYPHSPDDPQNKERLDWEEQVQHLAHMGVKIYGVQVSDDQESSAFFSKMAATTGGKHLKLTQFGHLCDVIMAICYKERGAEFLENFHAEVGERTKQTSSHNKDLEGVFDVLRGANPVKAVSTSSDSVIASEDSAIPSEDAPSDVLRGANPAIDISTSSDSAIASASRSSSLSDDSWSEHSFGCEISFRNPWPPKHSLLVKAKTARKKAKSHQPKKSQIKRKTKRTKLRREKVPETNFKCRDLAWSPWALLAVPSHHETESGTWREKLSVLAKIRRDVDKTLKIKPKSSPRDVFLEVSVQTQPKRKRHVMWGRLVTLQATQTSFGRLLLAGSYAKRQLARVMRSGCRVFVRAAELKKNLCDEVHQVVTDTYDYAWCPWSSDCCHRNVFVPGGREGEKMQIAGEDDV